MASRISRGTRWLHGRYGARPTVVFTASPTFPLIVHDSTPKWQLFADTAGIRANV